jgi:spore maturation protein CgeB
MQLCDNASHLAQIYKLGKEVVGYESTEEAIELCQYYINNDEERQKIAIAGWRRTIKEYNEVAVFQRVVDAVNEFKGKSTNPRLKPRKEALSLIRNQRKKTLLKRFKNKVLYISKQLTGQ